MKLRYFSVEHFKNIGQIRMENIGDLNILVGQNNSGKSNILDAIQYFFQSPSENIEFRDILWTNIERKRPIVCEMNIEINTKAFSQRLSRVEMDLLRSVGIGSILNSYMFGCTKFIDSDTKKLILRHMTINGDPIIANGEGVGSASDVSKALAESFHSFLEHGIRRLDIIGAAPLRQSLVERVERTRKRAAVKAGERELVIREDTLDIIRKWISSKSSEGRIRMRNFQETFFSLSVGSKINLVGEDLEIDDGHSQLPIMLAGSGTQHTVELAFEINQDGGILILEEPGAHMHPTLRAELLQRLLKVSEQQQLFLTTHSPTFINKASMSDIWLIRKDNHTTSCKKIDPDSQLSQVVYTLGYQFSDIFDTYSILFVEGECEEILLPVWSKLRGVAFSIPNTRIVQMKGASNARHKAEFWKPIVELLKIPAFWLFDGDVDDNLLQTLSSYGVPEKHVMKMDKLTIESYYPEMEFKELLVEEYSIAAENQGELDKALASENRPDKIHDVLKKHGNPQPRSKNDWKILAARHMATLNKIPHSFLPIINSIIELVKGSSPHT